MKSDPLRLECYIVDAEKGLVGNAGVQKFMVMADSFVSLVRTFENTCAADKQLSQNKPPTLYQCCNVQQFWVRSAACRECYGQATQDEIDLVCYILSYKKPVCEPFCAYLWGLGDFTDPSRAEHRLHLI